MTIKTTLPNDSAARKRFPLRKGCISYFPAILNGVANVSIDGNDKHNPGEELHHARGKSMDHADCIDRHLTDVEDILAAFKRNPALNGIENVSQLLNEVNQLAWRALALGQQVHEEFGGAPLAPSARLPVPEPKPGTVTMVSKLHGTSAEPHQISTKTGRCWCGYPT